MDHRRSPVARLMLLSLLVMGAVEASAAAATAVRPLKSLDVVDATGQLLGPVMSLDGVTLGFQSSTPGAEAWMSRVPTVVVEAAGRLLPLRVFRT